MQIEEPNCYKRNCKHWEGCTELLNGKTMVCCVAFPYGIPDDIAYGDNDHDKVVAGQKGLFVYEESE